MAAATCPIDGTVMERGVRPMTIAYKGRQLSIDMPGHYCPACGEGVHGGGDLKISDRALNRLKADVEGLLPPDGVRRIRRRLGLTQREAGRILGGGTNAFQKYECGDVLISRAISNLLVLLDKDPRQLAHLTGLSQSAAA